LLLVLTIQKLLQRTFIVHHKILTAEYRIFETCPEAKKYIEMETKPLVLNASGLAAGKGVLMPDSREEAVSGLKAIMIQKNLVQQQTWSSSRRSSRVTRLVLL
jgi:phosphoribosylamine--glycine ligase / phosphoribosylformylglycinamidine cyclo-ligase